MSAETKGTYAKPLPDPDPEERPYWQSLKRHAMEIQRCADCGKFCFQPKPICPSCWSERLVWTKVSGRGTVWASTTQHHPPVPAFKEDVPYNISLIELDEGVRILSNVIDCPVEAVKIGMKVEVIYQDVTDQVTLAKFRPRAV